MNSTRIVVAPLYPQSYPKGGSSSSHLPMFIVRAHPVDEAGRRGVRLANRVFTGGNRLSPASAEVRFVDSGTLYAIGAPAAVVRALRSALRGAGYESVEFQSAAHSLEVEPDPALALAA